MSYVAITGGQEAIKEAEKLLHYYRYKAGTKPIEVKQIREQMRMAVDKAMSEGSLYDPDLAALALKQAEGDAVETSFLLRAFRSTLPRNSYSLPVDTSKMEVIRRISASFKEIPGGQFLGPTRDYTKRLLNFDLLEESEEHIKAFMDDYLQEYTEEHAERIPEFPKVIDILRKEGLINETNREQNQTEEIDDITRQSLKFPVSRAMRLQTLARGETGAMMAMAYSAVRGYGDIHPTIGELRVGYVPLHVPHPLYENETIAFGKVLVTEVEIVSTMDAETTDGKAKFSIGYGLCFGHNELKAISMGILDRTMKRENPAAPAEDEEFVLYHIDGIEASGFVSHFKLPHYVDFQADLVRMRSINDREENENDRL